jgi:hypothetical protein
VEAMREIERINKTIHPAPSYLYVMLFERFPKVEAVEENLCRGHGDLRPASDQDDRKRYN